MDILVVGAILLGLMLVLLAGGVWIAMTLAIAAVAVGYLAWWANRFTWDSYVFDETAQGMLPIKMWIPQSTFAIGAILLFVAVFDELVVVLRGGRPSYVVAVEERHAHGDFSSEV